MGKATTKEPDRLRDATRQVFATRAKKRLGNEDLREISENLVGFFTVLGEWSRTEEVQGWNPKTSEQK